MPLRTFTAHFILNGHSAGSRIEGWPEDGRYPTALEHDSRTYFLLDGAVADDEAYYAHG